jgi:hypothetical protein
MGFCLVVYTVPCLRTIDSSGTLWGNYYSIPQRSITLIRWKLQDIINYEVLEWLSMLEALPAIRIVCVLPAWVIVMLGLHNPPRSWTGTCAPPLSGGTIAPCADSLLCYGSSDGLSPSFKIIPKSKVRICIYTLVFELSLLLPRLGFISTSQSACGFIYWA